MYLALLLLLAAGVNSVQLNALMPNMPQLIKLDVQCAKDGMTVQMEFDLPFNGIIFSKGYFSDPSCRYVEASSNGASYQFIVPMQGCGTEIAQSSASTGNGINAGSHKIFSNIVIIQNDGLVQEIWDSARKLTCTWVERVTKTLSVRPLSVNMLEATEARFGAGEDVIDVWMDLQYGKWPDSKAIDSAVRIGDTLTLAVGARDAGGEVDLQVKDCYAHSTQDFNDPKGYRIQLTDFNGCVIKKKLLSPFSTDRGTGQYEGNIIKYSLVSAFSFPDSMEVFTSCNVEICKGECEPNPCQPGLPEDFPSGSTLLPEGVTTTESDSFVTFRTTKLPLNIPVTPEPTLAPITPPRTDYLPPDNSYLPPTIQTVPVPQDTPFAPVESVDVPSVPVAPVTQQTQPARPQVPTTTPAAIPTDYLPPVIPQDVPSIPTIPATVPTLAPVPTRPPTRPPVRPVQTNSTTNTPTTTPGCTQGSQDSSCATPTTPSPTPEVPSLDYLPPPECVPGSTDPRCPAPEPQKPSIPQCFPGTNDPRCPSLPPANPPVRPQVNPPSTPQCFPGSTNPLCRPPVQPAQPSVLPLPDCIPGSTDPRCQTIALPAPAATATILPPALPTCYPGSPNPLCRPKPAVQPAAQPAAAEPTQCPPGSKNPECLTNKPLPGSPLSQPVPVLCAPGSKNPECLPQPIPGGSNQFEVTEQTDSAFTPRTTQKPNKEWSGDPSSHAFHMFHFQRGDGRRNRVLQRTKVKRSAESTPEDVAKVRLTRSIRILPIVNENFSQPELQEAYLKTVPSSNLGNTFCITSSSFVFTLTLAILILVALVISVTAISLKYLSLKSQVSKFTVQEL